jgi:rhamnose transport system permease protein
VRRRELSLAVLYAALLALLALAAPGFFTGGNLRDLVVGHAGMLVLATGMTLVIVAGEIDVSIGSQVAVCGVVAGLLAKSGMPMPLVALAAAAAGALLGAINGALVAGLRIPSIVATLATMLALRDALRWATGGAWVLGLPERFQWFGLPQKGGELAIAAVSLAIFAAVAWGARSLAAGRAIYAAGADRESAELLGLRPRRVTFRVFAGMGAASGLAAVLDAVRFTDVQANAGIGLEMAVIAAVVVGGTSIRGGRGTLAGTLAGVVLLGTLGTALTFLGVSAYWERALQGAIVIAAVAVEAAGRSRRTGRAGRGRRREGDGGDARGIRAA